jgi:hypothetical protein
MSSSRLDFNWQNEIRGPANLALDGTVLGWIHTDGVNFKPSFKSDPIEVDQSMDTLGDKLIGLEGTVSFKPLELLESRLALLLDLAAGSDIAAPLAGAMFNLRPNDPLTVRRIEWWTLWGANHYGHYVIGGTLANHPQMDHSRQKPTIPELVYNRRRLSSNYPAGLLILYDAVAGAPTATCVPADAAVDQAAAVQPTFTFTKPMSVLALLNQYWSFTKDADSSEVAFAPAFATTTVGSQTIIDVTKIKLVPGSALTAGAAYTVKCRANTPAIDGAGLAAELEINFTVAA